MRKEIGRLLPGMDNRHTPLSDHLFKILREQFSAVLPIDADYESVFDRFEYALGLVYVSLVGKPSNHDGRWWGPIGRFAWKTRNASHVTATIQAEMEKEKDDWSLLKAGFFNGSLEEARKVKSKFDEFLNQI